HLRRTHHPERKLTDAKVGSTVNLTLPVQVNFRVLEGLCAAALYFLVLTTLWGLIQKMIEVRVGRGYDRNYRRKGGPSSPKLDDSAMKAEAVNR
ncbi:hypothetical protein R3P93_21280, partial [Rhodococcus cerastii]|nr:hypothetical protein [Rhodococcus cerastii]